MNQLNVLGLLVLIVHLNGASMLPVDTGYRPRVTKNQMRNFTRLVNGQTWTYVTVDREFYFNQAELWCRSVGGDLPAIHSQEDFDYLMDTVVVQHSPGPHSTWIGLEKTNGTCNKYLDGTNVDFNFEYFLDRSQCDRPACDESNPLPCAMRIFNEDDHKKAYFLNSGTMIFQTARAVCVIKGPVNDTLTSPPEESESFEDAVFDERQEEEAIQLLNNATNREEINSQSITAIRWQIKTMHNKLDSLATDLGNHRKAVESENESTGLISRAEKSSDTSSEKKSFWWLYAICALVFIGLLVTVVTLLKRNNLFRNINNNVPMRFQNRGVSFEGSTSAIYRPNDSTLVV